MTGFLIPPEFREQMEYYQAEAARRVVIRGGSYFICQKPVSWFITRPKKERSGLRRGAYRVYAPNATSVTDTKDNAYVAETRMAGTGFEPTGWWEAMGATTLTSGDSVTGHRIHCGVRVKINKPRRFIKHANRHHPGVW